MAKLTDIEGSRRSLRDFGLPRALAGWVGVGLPIVELVIAAGLIGTATARVAALGALVLLAGFSVAIVAAMRRGQAPDCHCFGQLSAAPVGRLTLARNAGLGVLAGLVLVLGAGPSLSDWVTGLAAWERVALVGGMLLGALGWFSLQLLRQNGRIIARLEALEAHAGAPGTMAPDAERLAVGAEVPDFQISKMGGGSLDLADLRDRGRPVALVFTHPGCGPCTALLPSIAKWQADHHQELTVALITRADEGDSADVAAHEIIDVGVQDERDVAREYRVYGTPAALVIDPGGRVAIPVAYGADAIEVMVANVLDEASTAMVGSVDG